MTASLRIARAYARASVVELFRYPSFSVPALLFPAAIFVVFTRAGAQAPDARMAGFAGVAVLGVVFFQFGVGIAAERATTWELFLRTLPVAPRVRIAGRVVSALAFASAAAGVVVVVAAGTTAVSLPPPRWGALALALLVGGIPFGLLGIAIGYLARPRAALPLANLLYLPLSYLGGLWAGPAGSPGGDGRLVDVVPTHAWAVVLWGAVGAARFDPVAVGALAAWTVPLAAVAAWAYRRDEGERYT